MFSLLNYEYTAQTVSLRRFPSSLDGRINTLQILAGHDDFKVFHCEVDQLILGLERPIIDNLLKDHPYSLFLFSDASKNAWHFINVKYDEEETRRKLFRRIVIGPDERLHTAAQRIAMLEVHDDKLSPLDLQQKHDTAFDVEVVTKEFFNSFVQMFHLLREEIEELNPRYKAKSAEFSQMLLNRLMFLYFIQKKGWLDGNTSYLYERFRKGYKDQHAKHTYYSEVLLLIFKKLANTDLQFKQLGSIPFLNGGLFESEPWEDVLKISNGLFGKLFKDLFEHYNFTVREDTAMDMEVAIDPEMLGKVFENLILQLEKDPTTDLRKATGSYYTPRVIVHFMCQQSLKEYLIENLTPSVTLNLVQGLSSDTSVQIPNQVRNDGKGLGMDAEKKQIREKVEKLFTLNPASLLTTEEISWLKSSFTYEEAERLKNLILNCRVCDPAVGSGAFVVGMLHEMVAIIKLLDMLLMGLGKIQERNYDYELKRKIIEYCLYGVDIQEQAVRICELRLWLSLVVDYQGKDIPPLPNLSYRIRQGDSLIDKLFGYPVNLNIPQTTERGEKLKQLIDSIQKDKHAYFDESDIQKKRKAELGILAKQCDLASLYLKLRQDIVSSEYEAKYGKGLFGYKELRKAEREDKETLQKEITELEKLILFAKNTKDKLLAVEKGKLIETEKTRQLNETFVWKLDFTEVYKEIDGFHIIVTNPPYRDIKGLETDYVDLLFEHYATATNRINLYSCFIELATSISAPNGIVCFINPNSMLKDSSYESIRKLLFRLGSFVCVLHFGLDVFDDPFVEPIVFLHVKKRKDTMCMVGDFKTKNDIATIAHVENSLMAKDQLTWEKSPFSSLLIFVQTTEHAILDGLERRSDETLHDLAEFCLGLTPYDKYKGHSPEEIRKRIFHSATKKSTEYKPMIDGSNVLRYWVDPTPKEWIKYGPWLGAPRNPKFFKGLRIIVRQILSGNPVRIYAGLTEAELYHSQVAFAIRPNNLQNTLALVAFLNSDLVGYYHMRRFADEKKQTFNKILIQNAKILPVPKALFQLSEKLNPLVQNIVESTSNSKNVEEMQLQVDRLVYEAAGVSKAEVELIHKFYHKP